MEIHVVKLKESGYYALLINDGYYLMSKPDFNTVRFEDENDAKRLRKTILKSGVPENYTF